MINDGVLIRLDVFFMRHTLHPPCCVSGTWLFKMSANIKMPCVIYNVGSKPYLTALSRSFMYTYNKISLNFNSLNPTGEFPIIWDEKTITKISQGEISAYAAIQWTHSSLSWAVNGLNSNMGRNESWYDKFEIKDHLQIQHIKVHSIYLCCTIFNYTENTTF